MARSAHNDVLDATLDEIATADEIHLCNAEPTTYTEASSTYSIASGTLTPGDGNGDFTIADGTSGRKVTVTAQTGLSVSASDTATHAALVDTVNSKLLFVTVTDSVALISGETADTPAFEITVEDPVAP